MSDPRREASWTELRRLAEARVAAEPASAPMDPIDLQRHVHELQVHQIELELQAEALAEAHAQIEAERRRYQALFELAPTGYLRLDVAGRIVEANLAAADLLGVDGARLVGHTLARFVEPASRPAWRAVLAALPDHPSRRVAELVIEPEGAPTFDARVDAVGVAGHDGARWCLCAVVDVSAQKEAERSLRQASKAKGEFLAQMSHELRTPMSGIYLAMELALKEELSPRARRFIGLAHRASSALLEIIAETLDLAKIEAGRVELRESDFELRTAIDGSISALAASAEAKGLTFALTLDPQVPRWVRGDRGRLGQVLVNLVGNAVKFTARGGVSVSVALADEAPGRPGGVRLLFTVKDTGIGFSEAASAAIFERFTQVQVDDPLAASGSGLGLTIARELVELMGGRIWAEGEPGVGSTFTFIVELASAQGDAPAAPEAPTTRPRRMVVADDDAFCRETVTAVLEGMGHTVTSVPDGEAALAELARGGYDLALVDLQMPRLGGVELTQRVRAGSVPGVPRDLVIVGHTAVSLAGDRERALAAGMDAFLVKPLDARGLAGALEDADRGRAGAASPASPG